MTSGKKRWIHLGLLAAALVLLIFVVNDTSELFKAPGYDATAPTSVKFTQLSRWLPQDADFFITVDVPRALANPGLEGNLLRLVAGRADVASELIAALVKNQKTIGLLAITGTLGSKDELPRLVVLAQGSFDKGIIIPAIRTAMAAGRFGITSKDIGWATLFSESDSRAPFGFIVLDKQHIAVGESGALEAFYGSKPAAPDSSIGRLTDAVIFGHISLGTRLAPMMPAGLKLTPSVDFSSDDGVKVTALLPCEGQQQAYDTRLFLEGARSLILLEQENNPSLVSILKGISIGSAGNEVSITAEMAPLVGLWLPDSGKERDDPAEPDVE